MPNVVTSHAEVGIETNARTHETPYRNTSPLTQRWEWKQGILVVLDESGRVTSHAEV